MIADHYGALILDSDFAKRKLPELDGYPWGAAVVHEESSDIVFGPNPDQHFESLFQKSIESGRNIVMH